MRVNIIKELRDFGLDGHEAVVALQSATAANGRRLVGLRAFKLLTNDNVVASIELNSEHEIKTLDVETKLWSKIRPIIEQDSQNTRHSIVRSTLLSHRKLNGFARVEGWLQILPIISPIEDRTGLGSLLLSVPGGPPSPFAVEVVYRDSDLSFLQVYRSHRSLQETVWLLTTFIDVPVFVIRTPFAFANLEGKIAVVRCGPPSGLEDAPQHEFSSVVGFTELKPVKHTEYFSQIGLNSQDFRVPDLAGLRKKFNSLTSSDRKRFLRACAWLSDASDPELWRAQRLVALVSAMEPLLESAERCEKCKSHVGITKAFRKFLDQHVHPTAEVRKVYESVYSARSQLVHGGWHYDVDEPFLGVKNDAYITTLAAWDAAKRGIVNWLLSR